MNNGPCQNGGVCQQLESGGYTCSCQLPYIGYNCSSSYSSCKQILAANTSATSGLYNITSSNEVIEVYCEMVINGGGYTFIPTSALNYSSNIVDALFNDTSKVIFRLISRSSNQSQPFTIMEQLSNYANTPISIQRNNNIGYKTSYTTPMNNFGNYYFVSFVPSAVLGPGVVQGYKSNNQSIPFTNCNSDTNSYWALFASLGAIGGGCCGGPATINTWISSALAHPLGTYMPTRYFYFAEILLGGCGGFSTSDRFTNYYGVAIGVK